MATGAGPPCLSGTVTVRLIRSFEHRNIKHLCYTNVDFQTTTQEFIEMIENGKDNGKIFIIPYMLE